MSITNTLKDALVSDLQDIDGTGIFDTTIAEALPKPRRFDEMKKPGAFVVAVDFNDSLPTLTNLKRETTATFGVLLATHGSSAYDAMDDFVDDVRNAVQRDGSNIKSVSQAGINIENIDVNGEWDIQDEGVDEDTVVSAVFVIVRYFFETSKL